MISGETFKRWIVMTVFCLASVAFFGILILHLGLRLRWRELLIPLLSFAALEIGSLAGMLWAAKTKTFRVGALALAASSVGFIFLLAHYGSRWGLHTGFEDGDVWGLIAFISAVAVGLVLMPRKWSDELFAPGVKCAKCHHNHEGKDCICGCRADQFKYPSFQFP